jgi:hypothetical protein
VRRSDGLGRIDRPSPDYRGRYGLDAGFGRRLGPCAAVSQGAGRSGDCDNLDRGKGRAAQGAGSFGCDQPQARAPRRAKGRVQKAQEATRCDIGGRRLWQKIGMESLEVMTNRRGLDHNPLTGLLPLLMLKGDVALLSMILLGRGTIGYFQ